MRNLTRAQSKCHGCGYVGVELSVRLCKCVLMDAAHMTT